MPKLSPEEMKILQSMKQETDKLLGPELKMHGPEKPPMYGPEEDPSHKLMRQMMESGMLKEAPSPTPSPSMYGPAEDAYGKIMRLMEESKPSDDEDSFKKYMEEKLNKEESDIMSSSKKDILLDMIKKNDSLNKITPQMQQEMDDEIQQMLMKGSGGAGMMPPSFKRR
jgi:hypothetical protein